ncbi:MAG: DivIVA domain-containing protein [Gemmatimonadota bacterium]
MIDLTPLEVRKKKGDFKRALRGYDGALVDDFLDLVADRLEQVVRNKLALEERVRELEQRLAEFTDREKGLTDALVSAQEMREETRQQMAREVELIRREAEAEAERIRQDAHRDREREEDTLRRLRARQRQLVSSYRSFLEREIGELDVIHETLELQGRHAGILGPPESEEDAEDQEAGAGEPGRDHAEEHAEHAEGRAAADPADVEDAADVDDHDEEADGSSSLETDRKGATGSRGDVRYVDAPELPLDEGEPEPPPQTR